MRCCCIEPLARIVVSAAILALDRLHGIVFGSGNDRLILRCTT